MHLVASHLEASLLDPSEWHKHRWFRSFSGWHYHIPDTYPEQDESCFSYSSVDESLRGLILMLHQFGFRTTPSCQGHRHSKHYYLKLYDALGFEEKLIQGSGLEFVDSQTGKAAFFQDKSFQLPWSKAEDYCTELLAKQWIGYLGILSDRIFTIDESDPLLHLVSEPGLVSIYNFHQEDSERFKAWKRITQVFAEQLHRIRPPTLRKVDTLAR